MTESKQLAEKAMIRFRCASCSRTIRAPESRLGEAAACPGCGNPIIVGENRVALAEQAAAVPPPESPPRLHDQQRVGQAHPPTAEEVAKAKTEAKRKAAEEKARKEAEEKAQREAEKAAKAKAEAEHSRDCEPLLELATPHLYRDNLFRVLGLSVDATPKDVQRQQNRRKIQEELGIAATDGRKGPLAITPAPTNGDMRGAIERLNRPMDRLLHEVFWFWPCNGSMTPDPALQALEQGNLKQATEIWKEQAKLNGQGKIAIHNLAVIYHMIALDHEGRLGSEGLSEKQKEGLLSLWTRAFSHWKEVLDGEEFWSALKNRVRSIDDVTLTTGFARRIRMTLPKALLLINAKIAYSAAERSDAALARRANHRPRRLGLLP